LLLEQRGELLPHHSAGAFQLGSQIANTSKLAVQGSLQHNVAFTRSLRPRGSILPLPFGFASRFVHRRFRTCQILAEAANTLLRTHLFTQLVKTLKAGANHSRNLKYSTFAGQHGYVVTAFFE
jgi:hypothetical protein